MGGVPSKTNADEEDEYHDEVHDSKEFEAEHPENQEPIAVRVRMVNGEVLEFSALPFDTVRRLKAKLAAQTGVPAHQQRLLLNTEILRDQLMLRDARVDSSMSVLPELTLVLGPPIPSWGVEQGFDADFTGYLREYFAKHSQEQPPWLDHDVEIWERFRMFEEENLCRFSLRGLNNHFVQLMSKDGEIRGIIRARPGELIELEARGWIQNCSGENANHQLLLAVDTWVVGELYSGLPNWKDHFSANVSFTAPQADGVYMLWRSGDLQPSMADAKRIFSQRITQADPELFPNNFVGWLSVTSPPLTD